MYLFSQILLAVHLYDDPVDFADALMQTGKEFIVRFELEEHADNADEDGI